MVIAQVHHLANDYIVLLKGGVQDWNAVLADGGVGRILVFARVVLLRLHELLLATRGDVAMLLVLVHRVVEPTEQPTLDRRPVHNDAVLLVVATVARDGDDGVDPVGHLVHLQDVHRPRLHQRTGQGQEQVAVLVQTLGVVAGVDAHCLLAHRRLIGVSRRLVVVRQWDAARHVPHNETGVNLVVGVMRGHVLLAKGNPQGLRLGGINVFHAGLHPRGPVGSQDGELGSCPKDGADETTCVGLDDEGVQQGVPRHRDVGVKTERLLGGPKLVHDGLGIGGVSNDDAVQGDGSALVDVGRINPGQVALVLEEVEHRVAGDMLGDTRQEAHRLDDAHRVTLGRLHGADEPPGRAVELAGSQKLARLLHRCLDATQVAERGDIGHATEHLRDTHLGRVGQTGGVAGPQSLDGEVARSKRLLELALDGRELENLVEVVDVEDVHRARLTLLPGIVVDFLDELVASVVADLLEELTEQMGQKRTGGDDTLVGIRIAVVQRNCAHVREQEPTNHAGGQHTPAGVVDGERGVLSRELDVREILGRQELTNVGTLVLLVGAVLEVDREELDGVLLGEDANLRTVAEGRTQELDVRVVLGAPDQLGNLAVSCDAERTEVDHDGNVLAEARDTRKERIPKAVELGGQANLQLLGRHCEALVKRLHLHRVGVLGTGLLGLKHHDAIVCNLLLTEDRPLGPMDEKVAERVVRTLSVLGKSKRVVLEKA